MLKIKKIVLVCILLLYTGVNVFGQQIAPINSNFKNRTEYINAIVELLSLHLTSLELKVGINIISKDDLSNYKAALYISDLERLLFPDLKDVNMHFDVIYYSIGKVLHKDTIFLTNKQINSIKDDIVDEVELQKMDSLNFEQVITQFLYDDGNYRYYNPAIYYYFDRRFYVTMFTDKENKIDINFNYFDNHMINLYDSKKGKPLWGKFDNEGNYLIIEQ